jgi:Cof subfamily protein (haloacid dehalogenase superfamily)
VAVRALFLDLDGTLVGRGNTVSPRVRRAVGLAREAGCEVVLCTGRSRISTVPVADQLGFRGWAIVSNGAVALHLGTGEVLYRSLLPIPAAVAAVRQLIDAGLAPQVYEDAVESARILYHPEYPVEIHTPSRFRSYPGMVSELPFSPACVVSFGPEERLRPVGDRFAASPSDGVLVQQAGTHAFWCVELHHAESGKCSGLQRVSERLGLPREETLAVGDHLNDLRMLDAAGIGVAMGNALPEVRCRAAHVTGTVEEDGVAQVIERFVLENRDG